MRDLFVRRLSLLFIILLALLGSIYFLMQVFSYTPPEPQLHGKPDVEIHFGGPPLQEMEKEK